MILQSLAEEVIFTVSSGAVWLSIGQALTFGGISLLFGIWVARHVGLLASGAPAAETLSVGLASGLIVLSAWWAAIWSGGRSSFTPVAIGFAIAIPLAVVHRTRTQAAAGATAARRSRVRSSVLTTLAGGAFVIAVAVLYGSTISPSPRDGVQPMESNDEAFYSILGRDLATTGTETNLSPSGFADLPGLPSQTWYHWGELWLASAVITLSGAPPLAARYLIVLPVVLLAAAAMTGTVVRRMAMVRSRRAFLLGFFACLFLSPVSLPGGPFMSGLVFEITLYGLAAVAVLLAMYALAVLPVREPTWAAAVFVGVAAAYILPAHVLIAFLAGVGLASVWGVRMVRSLMRTRRLPAITPVWRRTLLAAAVALVTTVLWGVITGHSLGSSGSPNIGPFDASWRQSVALALLGAGVFLAIPLAWALSPRTAPADLYFGTMALLITGTVLWGARLEDVTAFHFLFAGVATFAIPATAVAVWSLLGRLRASRHPRLAVAAAVLCVAQLEYGVVAGAAHLQAFGPTYSESIPVDMLVAIRRLPADAKLAYACQPFEEVSFADQRLLSIDAHTGRRVVPMCFQADVVSVFRGGELSLQVPNSSFAWAPQRALYPDASARPSSGAVSAFLEEHGIDYIYADAAHPNALLADAVVIASSGDFKLLRVP